MLAACDGHVHPSRAVQELRSVRLEVQSRSKKDPNVLTAPHGVDRKEFYILVLGIALHEPVLLLVESDNCDRFG